MDNNYGNGIMTVPVSEFRRRARESLSGNWGMAVLTGLIYWVLSMAATPIPLANILIMPILAYGIQIFYLRLYRERRDELEELFIGFHNFGKVLGLFWLIALFTFLWTLLFFIPGIVALYKYSQAYFILRDNPDMPVMDAISQSKDMMVGKKWKLFVLDLSFIGWYILCFFTVFIGYLWLIPYIYTARAAFYDALIGKKTSWNQQENQSGQW